MFIDFRERGRQREGNMDAGNIHPPLASHMRPDHRWTPQRFGGQDKMTPQPTEPPGQGRGLVLVPKSLSLPRQALSGLTAWGTYKP